MVKFYKIPLLSFSVVLGMFIFLSGTHSAAAASIPCPGVDGANGLSCGSTGSYSMGDAKCTETGYALFTWQGSTARMLGGQICGVGAGGDFPGYYSPDPNNITIASFPNGTTPVSVGWSYSKTPFYAGRTAIPSGEFSDDPNYNVRFYGGPAQLVIDGGWDDRVTINAGAASLTTTGCDKNVDSVYSANCPDKKISGSPNVSLNPGDPITLNVTNILRPSDGPNNGYGSWGGGAGSVYLNEVTRCYTATYIAYLNSLGATYTNVTSYHPGSTPGTCEPDPCTIIDFHPDTNTPAIGTTDNLYFTLNGNYSYNIIETNNLDTTQYGIATTGAYNTSAITQNRTYRLSCGNQTQDVSLSLPPKPVITLQANPTTVPSGGAANITWSIVNNVTSCSSESGYATLPPGGWSNNPPAASGSVSTGALTSSQTYEITCTGNGGTADSNPVVVAVAGAPTASLTANGSSNITVNVGDTINYAWSSANTDTWSSNASAVPNSCPAQGPWVANSNAGSISATVIASQSGCVYTITYNARNSATGQSAPPASVTININTSNSISASPNPISTCTGSGSTTLNVTSNQAFDVRQGSTSGTIIWSGGAGISSHAVTASSNTTYFLQKSGDTSSAGTLSTVTVTTICGGSGPGATISADSPYVSAGGSTTIRWSSSGNPDSCLVNPGGWTSFSGSGSTGAINSNTTYTITCKKAGYADATASVQVSVISSASPLSCSIDGGSAPRAAGSIWSFTASGGTAGNNYGWYLYGNDGPITWVGTGPDAMYASAQWNTPGTYSDEWLSRGSDPQAPCGPIVVTGGQGDLVVTDFHLTDASGNPKTTFAQNEQIYPSVTLKNVGTSAVHWDSSYQFYISFYSNASASVPAGTASDVNVYVLRAAIDIASGESDTYSVSSVPSGSWPANKNWTQTTNGTYTARVYLDSNAVAPETSKTNNQATSVYYIGSGPTCPSASVALVSSTINNGGTTQASAPAGWSGGTFSSGNTSVATISGSTVTGVGNGTSAISGNTDWIAPGGVSPCGLNPTTVTVAAVPSSPQNVTASAGASCLIEKIAWNAVAGATSYNIYRYKGSSVPAGFNPITQASRVGNTAASPFNDDLTSSGAGTYYYWVTAVNSSGESVADATHGAANTNSTGGAQPQNCNGNLVGSDKDITAINGNSTGLVSSDVCDAKTEGMPDPSSALLKTGDTIQFLIELCNNYQNPLSDGKPVTNAIVTDTLTNLKEPSGGWNIRYNGGAAMAEDTGSESACPSASPASNKFAVCGTVGNQTLIINLSGQSIAQGGVGGISITTQIASLGARSSYGRFQNSASVTYNTGGSPATATQKITTPLILYYSGIGVPTRNETP